MAIPLTAAGRTLESIRIATRRRFFLAAAFLALGTFLLSAAEPLLSASPAGQIGFLTGLILASLLIVLGLVQGILAASGYRRAFPLSEVASAAHEVLLISLALVLPVAAVATAAWSLLALPGTPLLVLPSLPPFWAPLEGFTAWGLALAARELASERMVSLASVGGGFVIALAVTSAVWSVANPQSTLEATLFPLNLLVMGVGFVLVATAFRGDAWVARSGRHP